MQNPLRWWIQLCRCAYDTDSFRPCLCESRGLHWCAISWEIWRVSKYDIKWNLSSEMKCRIKKVGERESLTWKIHLQHSSFRTGSKARKSKPFKSKKFAVWSNIQRFEERFRWMRKREGMALCAEMHTSSRSPILDLTKPWLCLRLLPSFPAFCAYSCRNGQRTMRMRKSSRGISTYLPTPKPTT